MGFEVKNKTVVQKPLSKSFVKFLKSTMKIFALALFIACTQAKHLEIEPSLTGGSLAVAGEFPSAVLIRSPGTQNPLCGGSIIDSQHV